MLSTVHSSAMIPQPDEKVSKPLAVIDYNKNMGLVDKSDMQMSFSDTTRRSMKWYKKLFFRLLDLTIYNAYILFKYSHQEDLQLSTFRMQLIKEICTKFGHDSTPRGQQSKNSHCKLVERHFISSVQGKHKMRRCHVCSHTSKRPKKRTRTHYECKQCNVGLCVELCFQNFHTHHLY